MQKRIMFSLNINLINLLDEYAKEINLNRSAAASELMTRGIKRYYAEHSTERQTAKEKAYDEEPRLY